MTPVHHTASFVLGQEKAIKIVGDLHGRCLCRVSLQAGPIWLGLDCLRLPEGGPQFEQLAFKFASTVFV